MIGGLKYSELNHLFMSMKKRGRSLWFELRDWLWDRPMCLLPRKHVMGAPVNKVKRIGWSILSYMQVVHECLIGLLDSGLVW
ncbi:MAG: hypothetical protein ACK56F_14195 [bacterium]